MVGWELEDLLFRSFVAEPNPRQPQKQTYDVSQLLLGLGKILNSNFSFLRI